MTAPVASTTFWTDAERVAQFAARPPDHRLVQLVRAYPDPTRVQVLDLGCAGGRNTEFLVRAGFRVLAQDASEPMVTATRLRLVPLLGEEKAGASVRLGRMDDLDPIPDGSIDLIVALGIYHAAADRAEWDRTLAASHRVAARGARVLVANHTAAYDPEGTGLTPVPGAPGFFDGLPSGRSCLLDAGALDREMIRHGFLPLLPTETVVRPLETGGQRATANGLYLKP